MSRDSRKPVYLWERWQGAGIPRLLLVDDDAAVRRTAARFLSGAGFEVVSVGSGRAAMTLIHANESFDVAVIDLEMPGMDGIALMHELARARPMLPVGLWSASARLEELTPEELAPARFVKHKMQPIGELVQAVCKAVYGARASAEGAGSSGADPQNGEKSRNGGGSPIGGDARAEIQPTPIAC